MSGFRNGKVPFTNIHFKSSREDFVRKYVIKVAELYDNALYEAIAKIAKEEGFTDLTIIDKEFVVTALKNEIKRRELDG